MEVRKYFTLEEEIFNAIIHGVGALLSIAALVLLVIKADTPKEVVAVTIYASSSIILYTMSTIYHSFPKGITKNVFERFDHLSIYLLIAGTYTPFCLVLLDSKIGLILFFFQWILALIGIILKSIWINRFVVIHVIIFLLMGWSIVYDFNSLITSFNNIVGFYFLLIGGVLYSIGTIFYVFPIFKFHHAIWHFFVLFGSIMHFFAIYFFVI